MQSDTTLSVYKKTHTHPFLAISILYLIKLHLL